MIAYVLFNGALVITGFIGNLLIMLVFALNTVFHNMRSFLLASLALSDFLMVTIKITCRVISVAHKEWIFGKTWCYGLAFLERLCFINTLLHLCAVSYERYRAIVKDHLTYDGRLTAKKIIISISVLWVLPTLISLGPFFGWGAYEYNPELYGCGGSWERQRILPSLIALFVVPFVFMFVLNYKVLKAARRIKRQANIQLGGKTDSVVDGGTLQVEQLTSHNVVNCQQEDEENDDAPISPQEENQKTAQWIPAEESGKNSSELWNSTMCEAGRVELENALSKSGSGYSQERSSQHDNIIVVQHRVHGSNMKIGSEKMQAGASEEPTPRQFRSKRLSVAKCEENTLNPAVVEQRNPLKNAAQRALQLVNILKECKAAKDVIIITGAFLMCYLPVWIHGLYSHIEGRPYSTAMLLSVNSVFSTTYIWNPIIYSVRKKEFRKAVKRLLKIHD